MESQPQLSFFEAYILQTQGLAELSKFRKAQTQNRQLSSSDLLNLNQRQTPRLSGQKIYAQVCSRGKQKEGSLNVLWMSILREFKVDIVVSYLLVQGESLCKVATAFLIGAFFDSLEAENRGLTYGLVAATAIVWIIQLLFVQNGWRRVQESSIKIKGALIYALFKKILELPGNSIQGDEQGMVTNAVTEFHDILENRSMYMYVCLSAPLAIIGLAAMLVIRIGWFSLAGIALSITCEYIHYHYANYNSGNLENVSKEKDDRMRIMGEIISAIRYIKMQVWEKMFMEKILRIRKKEMKGYIKYGAGISLEIALSEGISTGSMLLIFGLTAKFGAGLSSKAIVLAILDIMLIKLLIIYSSYGISCYYQINIILSRLASIFQKSTEKMVCIDKIEVASHLPNIEYSEIILKVHGDPEDKIINLNNFTAYYADKEEAALLESVDLRIGKGQFVGVFGGVGVGKSVFLNCLAHQFAFYSGQINVKDEVAFLEQQPIVFTGTIKQNILFGRDFDDQLYEKVIDASCLRNDLRSKQILDKFSTDLGLLDIGVLGDMSSQFIVISISSVQITFIAISKPIILAFAALLFIPLYFWNRHCSQGIIMARSLDLKQKGPVIGFFSQTLKGLVQIDVLKAQNYKIEQLLSVLSNSMQASFSFRRVYRAYCLYNAYITNFIIIGSYFALIAMTKEGDFLSVTFAAVFLVQINDCMARMVANSVVITSTLISVDRILSFNSIAKEKEASTELKCDSKIETKHEVEKYLQQSIQVMNHKSKGIRFNNFSMRYNANSKLALNVISLNIRKGQKVALVGRTGSGKSSLVQALYRLVEPEFGSIYEIDGINSLQMPLADLRNLFTCIPQVPFVFSESIRRNLDPFQLHTDQDLEETLQAVDMLIKVKKIKGGLSANFDADDISFSAGEKQLFCLARAILDKKEYLILDEATASIDHSTDEVIQSVLRHRFRGKTIITVAHRLQTIIDYDQIVVLAGGNILEMGSVVDLWRQKGDFYQMILNSGNQKQALIAAIENLVS